MLGTILVVIGVVLAIVDAFAVRRPNPPYRYHVLLTVAVILIGLGVLFGAQPFIEVKGN